MAADGHVHPLADGCPPEWASGWGEDEHGIFVDLTVGRVDQRMRWIVPGTFMMGAPQGEFGRSNDEGPQHSVTLTRGFWLGDTPVTQALWMAVMHDNPSIFKSEDTRPVETVSWEGCESFCRTLNRLVPGMGLRLPTEAEWEYACRAETSTATYGGENKVYPVLVLDPIAWFAGNSDRQTHPVKQKHPNAWGLYDMLGNVNEWCQDGKRHYDRGAQQDPKGHTHGISFRVTRGGSWNSAPSHVRAACRDFRFPSDRSHSVGFRLVRDSDKVTKTLSQ